MWRFTVAGGRRTEPINRDWDEFEIAALRALFSGNDNQSYLRRDGFTAGLTRGRRLARGAQVSLLA